MNKKQQPVKPKKIDVMKLRFYCYQMVTLQRQLHDSGLHATAHLINKATQEIGFEVERLWAKKPLKAKKK